MFNTMFRDWDRLKEGVKEKIGDGKNIEYTKGVLEIISRFISYFSRNSDEEDARMLAEELGIDPAIIEEMYGKKEKNMW